MAEVIDYIEFPSADGAASRDFFTSAFGWGSIDFGPTYTGIDGAGVEAGLDSNPERVAAPLVGIRTDDIDDAERRVRTAGGVVTRAQFDFPGGRRFHFREPGGCELSVWIAREEG